MKNFNQPMTTLAALLVAITFTACGKTSRESTSTDTAASVAAVGATPPGTMTFTSTNTSTNTSTGGNAPLSFSFTLNGNQNAITPAFSTDNVLKVKFAPGTTQGNSFHSASELNVTLTLNGLTYTPTYTSGAYVYGQVNETSNVIDLSSHVSQGSSIQIGVSSPKSDYYCTYSPNPFYYFDGTQYVPTNPLYNSYPGCRKAVFSSHQWSGTLTVQTSSTVAI